MLKRYQPFYESTRKKMLQECYGQKMCPCMQNQTDGAIEIEEADQEHCNAKTQKKASEPSKPKFKFSGGTCEVSGCAPGYIPNKEKTGCVLIPKK